MGSGARRPAWSRPVPVFGWKCSPRPVAAGCSWMTFWTEQEEYAEASSFSLSFLRMALRSPAISDWCHARWYSAVSMVKPTVSCPAKSRSNSSWELFLVGFVPRDVVDDRDDGVSGVPFSTFAFLLLLSPRVLRQHPESESLDPPHGFERPRPIGEPFAEDRPKRIHHLLENPISTAVTSPSSRNRSHSSLVAP